MARLILIGVATVAVALFLVFLGTYENFFFSYYEENTANRYIDIGCIPLFVGVYINGLVRSLRTSIKIDTTWDKLKEAFEKLLFNGLFYFFFFRPVASGALLIINAWVGNHSQILITGEVVDIYERKRSLQHELTVQVKASSAVYVFDTKKQETSRFNRHGRFEKRFSKGCLGLLYIR
jgi:uncharacterized membrane protein